MTMSGQMRKFNFDAYFEQLKTMPEPIMVSELPKVKLDLRGVRDYAQKNGIPIAGLTDREKKMFIKV